MPVALPFFFYTLTHMISICTLLPVSSSLSFLGLVVLGNQRTATTLRETRMEEQIELFGKSFVDHYYHLFDNDRASLSSLYQPTSMLTFEGHKILGVTDISAKLNQLPLHQCRHLISTIDSQPCSSTGGIMIFVSGTLQLSEEEHQLRFSQMFHLIPLPQGNFFVQNDIFRLNYA